MIKKIVIMFVLTVIAIFSIFTVTQHMMDSIVNEKSFAITMTDGVHYHGCP